MKLKGDRITIDRWVHTDALVVRVEVEAILPADDPSEPCLEPQTLKWLRQVRERAEAGDLEWLRNVGAIYVKEGANTVSE